MGLTKDEKKWVKKLVKIGYKADQITHKIVYRRSNGLFSKTVIDVEKLIRKKEEKRDD